MKSLAIIAVLSLLLLTSCGDTGDIAKFEQPRDLDAPSVPGNVTATAVSASKINLSWTVSTDDVGVAGYKVFKGGTHIQNTTTPSFADTGLSPVTNYCYSVSAYDAVGNESAQSSQACATTSPDTTPPTTPSNLINTPISSTQIDLIWNASTDDIGVAGYKIYRKGTQYSHLQNTTATSYSDTGLSELTTYCYKVSAYDAAGNNSSQCAEKCTTTLDGTCPTTPTNLTAISASSSQIDLSWTASTDNAGVAGYKIYRGGTYLKTVITNSTSDTGLSDGTQYCYKVSSFDYDDNECAESAEVCATTKDVTAPTVPTSVNATAISSTRIDLAWTNSTDNVGVAGYKVYRGGTFIQNVTSTSYSDTGLSSLTNYCYTASAYDAANNISSESAQDCATTLDPNCPSIPTGLTATALSSKQISLSWTASTDNVGVSGYKIYRDGTYIQNATSTTYTDAGLTASTEYCYTVSAFDAVGNDCGQSPQVCATTSSCVGTLDVGVAINNSISSVGEVDSYSFCANAGDTVFVSFSLSDAGTTYNSDYEPDAQVRLSCTGSTTIQNSYTDNTSYWYTDTTSAEITSYSVPATGPCTILVGDYGGNSKGNYGLFVQRLNSPENATPIIFGQTLTGSLAFIGDVYSYSFSANVGDNVFVSFSLSDAGTTYNSDYEPDAQVRLSCTGSTTIQNSYTDNTSYWYTDTTSAEITSYSVPATGPCTILVGDYGGNSMGTYSVTLSCLSGTCGP